jgi:membrane-associated phospholipid phosphatase
MHRYIKLGKIAEARKWFLLALIFGCLFLALTAFYATGVINQATLEVERWIIGRPLTQFDCVLVQWRNFGAATVTLVFLAFIGVVCGLTRYRWRVLLYLVILILIGIAVEELGKKSLALSLTPIMRSGMTTLTCPQAGHSHLLQLQLALGMWWNAPLPTLNVQDWAHTVSQLPVSTNFGRLQRSNSYPSGHAIRWWFTGLLLAYLFWKHVKPGIVRWLLVTLVLILSFFGAAIQFYVGVHFITDTLAGYLLGTALACCAIGLLIINEKKNNKERPGSDLPLPLTSSGDMPASKVTEKPL